MAHIYILQNQKGRYYIGSTTNLPNRISHHKNGHTPSTRKYGNVDLVFAQEYRTLKEARKIESWLKKMKRRDYIERIVKEGYIIHKPM